LCGGLNLLDTWEPAIPLSEVERKIVDRELKLRLHQVRFDSFEFAIKRYGYTGELTDSIFAEISEEINLNHKELTDRNSIIHFYY
jgi:hypothetical protein